ncbi:MAG: twin-arginine translocase TatA/TatE family subunit [Hymenobacter sp.]
MCWPSFCCSEPRRFLEIAKGLGQGIKEFKSTSKDTTTDTTVVTPRRDSDV